MIDLRTYWPSETIGKIFTSGIMETHSPRDGGMVLTQTIKGVWQFDWFYRFDARGVLEYRDDYPRRWYDVRPRRMWCKPGKEIFWGNMEWVGSSPGAPCQTTGLFGQYGWQQLTFYELLPDFQTPAGKFSDVLVMEYWQTWGDQPAAGAKMWMAPGVGQIRAEWTKSMKPTGYSMELECLSRF